MQEVSSILALVLATILVNAALAKVSVAGKFGDAVWLILRPGNRGVGGATGAAVGAVVIAVELLAAALLVLAVVSARSLLPLSAALSAVLFMTFLYALIVLRRRKAACQCFGRTSHEVRRRDIARTGLLAGAALLTAVAAFVWPSDVLPASWIYIIGSLHLVVVVVTRVVPQYATWARDGKRYADPVDPLGVAHVSDVAQIGSPS